MNGPPSLTACTPRHSIWATTKDGTRQVSVVRVEPVVGHDVVGRPSEGGDGPRTVLVAVDETPGSLHAASYGAGLARRHGCRLLLVHIRFQPPTVLWPELFGAACPVGDVNWVAHREHDVADVDEPAFLVALAQGVRQQCGVMVDTIVSVGNAAGEIARIANANHADVVVVGSPRSLLHRLFGSVASRLLRRRAWPVVVVP
jgi:nucleotide-binding universal stress UspA family protein